jgi:hypothetical protein
MSYSTVNPRTKLTGFPERYLPCWCRLFADACHIADVCEGALVVDRVWDRFELRLFRFCAFGSGSACSFRRSSQGYGRGVPGDQGLRR